MTIMQRPDKVPAGPTEGRFFALCAIGGFDVQSYPNYTHFVLRFLLLKYNKWYGSIIELHVTKKDESIICDYFDFLGINYFAKKIKTKKILNFKKIINFLITPWMYIDNVICKLVKNDIWHNINDVIPRANQKGKKGGVQKKTL